MIKISFKCRSYIIRIDLLLLSNKTFNFQNNMYGKDKIELINSWFHVTLHQFMVSCESLKILWLFFMYCRIFIILHDCILPGIPKVPLKPGQKVPWHHVSNIALDGKTSITYTIPISDNILSELTWISANLEHLGWTLGDFTTLCISGILHERTLPRNVFAKIFRAHVSEPLMTACLCGLLDLWDVCISVTFQSAQCKILYQS